MKKKVFIGIGVAVVIVAFVAVAIVKNMGAAGTGAMYSVEVSKIAKGDISTVLSANGTVKEIDKYENNIDSPIKVTKVYVNQNDSVKKGQKLVDFDFTDINYELEQKKIQKRTQELTLKKLAISDSKVSTVTAENALNIAQNSLVTAQRNYDEALKSYNDSNALYTSGAIAKSDLDKTKSTLKDAEDALTTAKLNIEAQKNTIKDTSKTNSQAANVKQVDIEAQKLSIQTCQLEISDMENKKKKYEDARYAARDGVVTQVNVSEGGNTPSGQPAFVIVDPQKLEVKMNVNEYNAKQIKIGQEVDITGDSIPETDKITGKVSKISPIASKNTTSSNSTETVIEVSVAIDNATASIKPGITVNCDIKTVDIKNTLAVQLDMLSQDKDGNNYVYVLSSDKKTMHKKKIELGTTSDMKAEIKSGEIKDGDLAVMNPKPTYNDGARVKLIENVKGEEK